MISRSTIFLLIVLLLIGIPASSQVIVSGGSSSSEGSNPLPLRFGIGIGGYNGNKEFDGNTDFQARIFMRHYHTDKLQGELGIGFGSISDWFYETDIVPFDYRLIYSPSYYERWSPYVYGGFGFIAYDVLRSDLELLPYYVYQDYDRDGITPYIPLGIGMEYDAEEGLGFDFNLGYNIAFSDNLNGSHADKPSDAYWSFLFSVTFNNNGMSRTQYARNNSMMYRDSYYRDERRWDRGMTGPDYDGDGMTDEEERVRYHTDPFNPDTDGDGLRDSYEVMTFHTDPLKTDTDLDGLNDGDETRAYFTDPLKSDTDGDGLSDGEEIKTTKSNPLDPDTDHGGVKDGIEVAKSANPLDASDDRNISLTGTSTTSPTTTNTNTMPNRTTPDNARVTDGRTMTDLNLGFMLAGIEFQTASDQIAPTSTRILNRAYRVLTENPEVHLEIQGHTDNIGGAAFNLDLSQRRAQAVKIWLVGRGIDPGRLATKGLGFSQPISSNETELGRQKNRRIEFVVLR